MLELNGLKPKLFVEPFAGDASVALQLLATGHVERIAIGGEGLLGGELLKVVFFDTDWLINRVANIRVTLWQWRLMTVFHVFDDEPSAVRSIAWGLRT